MIWFLSSGKGIPEGPTAYVMTEQENDYWIWNAGTGEHFSYRDSYCPLQSISCLINAENVGLINQCKIHVPVHRFYYQYKIDWFQNQYKIGRFYYQCRKLLLHYHQNICKFHYQCKICRFHYQYKILVSGFIINAGNICYVNSVKNLGYDIKCRRPRLWYQCRKPGFLYAMKNINMAFIRHLVGKF